MKETQISVLSHDEIQKKLHTKLNTFMASRGLYKAVVRNIPIFLTKEEFFLGLNVSLPVNQWYFVHGGSQTPSMVALLAYSGPQSSLTRPTGQFSQHNLAIHHNTTEYSVAYFGFEDADILKQFIQKYDKFQVNDGKRTYDLQVS